MLFVSKMVFQRSFFAKNAVNMLHRQNRQPDFEPTVSCRNDNDSIGPTGIRSTLEGYSLNPLKYS